LHVFFNVDQVLAKQRSVAALRATPATDLGTGVSFPSWSPGSPYLAYQVERLIRGIRHSQIEVIGVDTTGRRFRGAPIVVSTDLNDASVYRPSWSQDAKYLAMYADRDGRGATGQLDIAILELQTEPGTGRVMRGTLQRGKTNRIATAVAANGSRGPSWSRATSGGIPQPALVYAQADTGRVAPIFLHLLDSWLSAQGLDAERIEVSAGFNSVSHREVTATESNGFVRYAYATEASGAEVVSTYDDRLARWARGPAPVLPLGGPVPEPRVLRASSLPLAFVFPGAGQLRGDHKVKGTVLAAVGVIGAGLFVKGTSGMSVAVDEAQVALDSRNLNEHRAAASKFNSESSTRMIGAGAFGAAWVVGLIDAAMQRKSVARVSAMGKRDSRFSSIQRKGDIGFRVLF